MGAYTPGFRWEVAYLDGLKGTGKMKVLRRQASVGFLINTSTESGDREEKVGEEALVEAPTTFFSENCSASLISTFMTKKPHVSGRKENIGSMCI